ncbi:MAG: hypothetical protein IPO63_07450 [Bacteroidetes bacterium]|nr:hypothetical protein [Bacteroidota bacterium]
MKSIIKYLIIFFVCLWSVQISNAQCTGGTSSGSITPTGSWQSLAIDGGTYVTFTGTAGLTYNFSFCSADGGSTSFDTQITILDNSGNPISGYYSDDYCGVASRVNFVCTSSGTYRVLANAYDCIAQTGLGTLRYKSFTPPACPAGLGTGVTNITSLPYSVTGVSTSGQVNDCNNSTMNSCGHSQDDNGLDRVFIFTPTTSGNFTVTLTASATNISLAVFQGCPLTGNVSTCIGYSYGNNNRTVTGCGMAGQTYYVVVDRRNTTAFTFSLAITATTPTSCSVGTVVSVASLPYSSVGRSTCGAVNDVTTANAESCGASGYYAAEEEVFSFVPASSGKVQVLLSSSAYNTAVFLVEGCPLATYCNGTGSTCIASAYGSAGNKILCGDVVAGRTYYVIADASAGCYSYNISISAPSTSYTGATCALPVVISSLPYQVTGENTACMGNDYSNSSAASCGSLYESGEDRVYRYTSTGPECISLTISGASTNNVGFQIYNGCPDVVGSTCIASGGGGYSGSLSGSINLPSAGTYYIIIDTYSSPSTVEYNLLIDTYGGSQDNDLPCDALELPLGVTVVGDVNCSNGSGEPSAPTCWATPNTLNSVWFYFTAPSTGNVTLRTTPGSLLNTQIGVYSGTCGTGLIPIGCNDNATACASTTTMMSQLQLTGLTPGNVYYVVADGFGTSTGTFGLLAINSSDAIPTIFGQECIVPLPICNDTVPVGDPGFQSFGNYCDFTGAGVNCLDAGERGSVWYEIPINASGDLEFNIIPNDWLGAPSTTCTDYDFALYKIQGSGAVSCAGIFADSIPIRCDYSYMGVTGCYGSSDNTAPPTCPGFGDSYVSKLPVLSGEKYVLIISNFSNSLSGFTMIFSTTSPVDYLTSPDTVYWTGSTDTDWFKSANWGGCAIPSCTRSAVIIPSSANQPVINAVGAAVNSISIEAGAKLTINSNRSLSVCGNFTNDGTINTRPNSTVVLSGGSNQTMNGNLINSSEIKNLTVSKTSGIATLNNDIDVSGNFTISTLASTFIANDKLVRLAGNFNNAIGGTFTQTAGGIIEFMGTSTQTYNNTGNLENVYMVSTGVGVSLSSDMNISSTGTLL